MMICAQIAFSAALSYRITGAVSNNLKDPTKDRNLVVETIQKISQLAIALFGTGAVFYASQSLLLKGILAGVAGAAAGVVAFEVLLMGVAVLDTTVTVAKKLFANILPESYDKYSG